MNGTLYDTNRLERKGKEIGGRGGDRRERIEGGEERQREKKREIERRFKEERKRSSFRKETRNLSYIRDRIGDRIGIG